MLRLKGMRAQQTQQYRNEWERTRWLAMFIVMPHSKKKLKPTDLVKFPWESVKTNSEAIIKHLIENKAELDKLTPIAPDKGEQISLKDFKKMFSQ